MTKIGPSGVRYLGKHHVPKCPHGNKPRRCDCQWSGRYKGQDVVLAKWTGTKIDPRTTEAAKIALTRMIAAIDEKRFDPDGELPAAGTNDTFAAFITEWTTHYAEKNKLSSNSLKPMLGVLSRGRLGKMSLASLAGSSQTIERWLDATAKQKDWKDSTWVRYYQLLRTIFNRACKWKVENKPRMASNPMADITPRVVAEETESSVRFEDPEIEARLIAACDQLDQPYKVTTNKIDQATADTIREAVENGMTQKAAAAKFKVSPGTVCDIVNGKIWNPAARKWSTTTQGTEMKRRVLCAFGTGLRASEMLNVQIRHIGFDKPIRLVDEATGTKFNGYVITLPARLTKGGKRTGKAESVTVGNLELAREVERRQFALRVKGPDGKMKPNPDAHVFGTEDGQRPAGFKKAWRKLFKLAGLDYGRAIGVVWHTARHEFASRVSDRTGGDTAAVMVAGRWQDAKTAKRYTHMRDRRKWAVAALVGGSRLDD